MDCTRLFAAEKTWRVVARGGVLGSGIGEGGCRSERRSRSSGRRRKLRWPETAADGEQWRTTAEQWQNSGRQRRFREQLQRVALDSVLWQWTAADNDE